MGAITRVPQTPHYVKGLINLRSTVIPVIDLRIRFGLPETDATDESRIMVVNVGGKTIGIVVDAVSEVLRVSTDQIAPPPPTVVGLGTEYLTGLVKLEKHISSFWTSTRSWGKVSAMLWPPSRPTSSLVGCLPGMIDPSVLRYFSIGATHE